MSRPIDADALADKVADLYTEGDEATEGDKVVNDVLDLIDKAPTVEYPEQITVECDTEEEKQKLLSALKNVKLKAVVEDERPQGEWQLHGMIYYCSKCGHECGESGDNFCGNCGADMREVKDEQTN